MVILGLLVVLLALLLGAALVAGALSPDARNQELDISLFDTVTISLSPLALIVAGMVAMLLLWLGLWMIKSALARRQRRRRDRKEHERLEAERDRERLGTRDRDEQRRLDADRHPDDRPRDTLDRDGRAGVADRDAGYRDEGYRDAGYRDDARGGSAGTRDRVTDRLDPRDRDLRTGEPGVGDTQRIDPRDTRR